VPRRFNPGIKEAILFALDNGIAYWTNVAVISPIVVSVSGILKKPSSKKLSNLVSVSVSKAKSAAKAGILSNPLTTLPKPLAGAVNATSIK